MPEAAVSRHSSSSAGQGFRPKALPEADCLEQEKVCWRLWCGPSPRLVLAQNLWEAPLATSGTIKGTETQPNTDLVTVQCGTGGSLAEVLGREGWACLMMGWVES